MKTIIKLDKTANIPISNLRDVNNNQNKILKQSVIYLGKELLRNFIENNNVTIIRY